MELLNKSIEYFATAHVAENEKVQDLIMVSHKILKQHPVDMLIFETKETQTAVRSAGYRLDKEMELDEKTKLGLYDIVITDKVWLKVDDYGDKYIATFLYPSEY